MAREGRKEKAETIKENGYACFKMENQFLILYYMPDALVEIFAGTFNFAIFTKSQKFAKYSTHK